MIAFVSMALVVVIAFLWGRHYERNRWIEIEVRRGRR